MESNEASKPNFLSDKTRLKVVSDGSTMGTRVYTEHGQEISNQVRQVSFFHKAGEVPSIRIELIFPEVELIAEFDDHGKAIATDPDKNIQADTSEPATEKEEYALVKNFSMVSQIREYIRRKFN